MAPSADTVVNTIIVPEVTTKGQSDAASEIKTSAFRTPLKYSGSLDAFEHFDVTSVIGREFPKLQLSEILEDDAKIRDLAITGTASFLLCKHVLTMLR